MSNPTVHFDLRQMVHGGLKPLPDSAGPRAYAKRLARYIRDASTIRARTINEYGTAPAIEEIKVMQAKAREERAVVRQMAERDTPDESEDPAFWGTPGLIRLAAERRAIQQRLQILQATERLDHAEEDVVRREVVTGREVITLTAQAHGMTYADLTGPSRNRRIVSVRHMAAWILLKRGRLSRAQIGRLLGGRDHSTVINSIRMFETTATPEQRELALRIANWRNVQVSPDETEVAPEQVGEAA